MAVSGITAFAIPIILFIYFRRKKRADILPFFVGCAVLLVFALVLESCLHQAVLKSPIGQKIMSNVWLYALYGGAAAALFEETGRLIAFKTVLRKRLNNNANALMYGAGHGGLEAAAIAGIGAINNIIYSEMLNSGSISTITDKLSGDAAAQFSNIVQQLITLPSYYFLFSGVERIFGAVLQISLSVLVWFAVKKRGKLHLFFIALAIHFTADAAVAVMSGYKFNTAALEAAIGVFSAATAIFVLWVWKKECSAEKHSAQSDDQSMLS